MKLFKGGNFMKNNPRKVIVESRLAYLHCWYPYSINDNEKKYSVCCIIPKSDSKLIAEINQAVEVAKREYMRKWGGKIPEDLKLPLRDGDIERSEDEAFKDCYFFNANSAHKPQVVDNKVVPIVDESKVYSGCYGRVSVTFYGYNVDGNSGIAAYLGNIQKLKDGEILDGRVDAIEEFEVIEDEDDFLF